MAVARDWPSEALRCRLVRVLSGTPSHPPHHRRTKNLREGVLSTVVACTPDVTGQEPSSSNSPDWSSWPVAVRVSANPCIEVGTRPWSALRDSRDDVRASQSVWRDRESEFQASSDIEASAYYRSHLGRRMIFLSLPDGSSGMLSTASTEQLSDECRPLSPSENRSSSSSGQGPSCTILIVT